MTINAPVAQLTADLIFEPEEPQCQHHWVIQPASGPFSQGICQTCGAAKEFKNYVEASTWGDTPAMNRVSAEVVRAVSMSVEEEEED